MVINKKQHNTKHRLIKFLISLSTLILISSCAVYKTGFECPAGKGEVCKSVTEVNEMVSRGELGRNIAVWSREPNFEVKENKSKQHKQRTEVKNKKLNKSLQVVAKKTKNSSTKIKSTGSNTVSSTKTKNINEDKTEVSNDKIKKECRC